MRSVGAPFAAWLMNSLNPADHTVQAMASPDNASVIAPAPVIYAAWLAVGAAVEYVSASSLLPFRIGVWVAVVLILIAIAIVVSAFSALARAQPPPRQMCGAIRFATLHNCARHWVRRHKTGAAAE